MKLLKMRCIADKVIGDETFELDNIKWERIA